LFRELVSDSLSILMFLTPFADGFLRQKIERFFWRGFSGEEFLPENSFLEQKMSLDFK